MFSSRTWISGARATKSHDTYMDFAVVPTCAFVDVKFMAYPRSDPASPMSKCRLI